MELRAFAEQVLLIPSLDAKLQPPEQPFTDRCPGSVLSVLEPARPPELQFAPPRTAPALPSPAALRDAARRGVAHHILANHELQALEVMASVLLKFPEAPPEFRLGLAAIMEEEQRHTRMHAERAARLGQPFGSLPVNCYIWKKSLSFTCVLDYLAGLPLVFEGRNLDHSLELATAFADAGDRRSAALLEVIHRDEIEHVRFGIVWLRRLKPPGTNDFDIFAQHLHWPLRPELARGTVFQRAARLAAGLDEEFVDRIAATESP